VFLCKILFLFSIIIMIEKNPMCILKYWDKVLFIIQVIWTPERMTHYIYNINFSCIITVFIFSSSLSCYREYTAIEPLLKFICFDCTNEPHLDADFVYYE